MLKFNYHYLRFTFLAAIVIILLFESKIVLATEQPKKVATNRPKIGLVLSGGGARGAAHIGVIKVLEELRIPIDFVSGTSMGSIVGGFYASGLSSKELETAILNIDWNYAFEDATKRESLSFRQKQKDLSFMVKSSPGFREGELILPAGFIDGQKLNFMLKALALPVVKTTDFDELPIPYRAVAMDIETGQAVELASGDLAYAMRASMSVPGVFSPIRINGKILVDGGGVNNLPIDVARKMGADIIIAVDVGTPPLETDKIKSVLDVSDQLTRLTIHQNVEAQLKTLKKKDILIRPKLENLGAADFFRLAEAISIGEKSAKKEIGKLKKISVSEARYNNYLSKHKSSHQLLTLDYIKIVNNSCLADDIIANRIRAKLGEEIDLAVLEKDLSSIYGLDIFERVDYQIITESRKTGLLVNTVRKPWGPNYLQFGIKLADDFDGENSYDLGIAYTMTELNHLGAEWCTEINVGETPRFFTEFYQPLDFSLHYFISPYFEYKNRNINRFDSGNLIAQYRVSTSLVGLEGGRQFGTWGEFSLGVRRSKGEAEVRIGDPTLTNFKFDDGNFFFRFSYDKFDDVNFPKHGSLANVEWSFPREELGADLSFNKVSFTGTSAYTWNRNTMILGVMGAIVPEDNIPLQHTSFLGGFLKLSGYYENELQGNQLLLGRSIFYRRVNSINFLPTYLGFSLETGNVWNNKDDISFNSLILAGSIFLGMDSFFGPLYLGFGRAEGGHNSCYLYLGRNF